MYRVTAEAKLLLLKAPRRPQSSRKHEGKVAVSTSDTRWCSDGFDIKCDSGETVTGTFAKACCDREVLAWRAWPGKGPPGEPVREAVERRFGAVEAIPEGPEMEFITDDGGAHMAGDTRDCSVDGTQARDDIRLQPAEQRHGRELLQHPLARLRQPHGPGGRHDRHGAVACGLRALQQRASTLEPDDAVAQRVQARSTAGRPDRGRVNQRIDRVRICGGKTRSCSTCGRFIAPSSVPWPR